MGNPYQSPSEQSLRPRRTSSFLGGLRVFRFAYPILITLLMYSCWGISAVMLGRFPMPYIDYPDNIFVWVLGTVTALTFVACPVVVPIGAILVISDPVPFKNWDRPAVIRRFLSLGLYALLWALVGALHYHDPWRVADWFFD